MWSLLHDSGGIRLVTVEDRVDSLVKLHLEVVTKLLAQSLLDSLEDVGEDTKVGRVLLIVVATLEDTSADQAGVPAVHVTTDDVGGGVVTNHVDVLGQSLLAVDLLHPRGHDLVGVLVGSQLGLTVDDTLKVGTGQGLVHGLKTNAEGTLGHTGSPVLSRAEHITLGEVNGNSLGDGVRRHGRKATVLAAQQIDDDLHVGSVVAGVGEDKDGLNVDLGEVAGLGRSTLPRGEVSVGGNGLVPCDNVVGDNNVLEAVKLSDFTALETLTTDDKDGAVVLSQRTHGSVRLDELLGRDGVAQDLGQLLATSLLGLTRAVGQEDVRNLDTKLVVTVEDLESSLALGDQTVTVDEHTVNVKGKGHVLGLLDLVGREILDL